MSDREISLIDLSPEPLVFRDEAFGGDGSRHTFRMTADLGLEDAGGLRRIQEELARASALIGKSSLSADELDQAARRIGEGLDAMLRMILPTLPLERLARIPLRGKQRLLADWQAAHPVADQEALKLPLGGAARATPRGRRSPGSSPPTA